MGGRVLATALAAAVLNDPANTQLEQQAHQQAEKVLAAATPSAVDDDDYAADKAEYRKRLTYGFTRSGGRTIPATVPKGAEALLRTRLPYLNDDQIREVLRTTALPSGYPLLDDAEGWGRLDLFSAASGYGAFDGPVTVSMDAAGQGLGAADTWRND
ncbi:phospholipid phosphatase, partial [Curtobacterium herbarum]|nr:phospholipid phosphatase [Curtobacterium herbarum]